MHIQEINAQLKQLTQQDWEDLIEDAQLVMQDDERLMLVSHALKNIFFSADMVKADSVNELKDKVLEHAEALLAEYYRKHPLTKKGFYHKALSAVKGKEQDFAAASRENPNCTLFVEGGEVVVEDQDSPRHPYGVYCELPANTPQDAIPGIVQQWLESGDAHENYLEMNVCRYFC